MQVSIRNKWISLRGGSTVKDMNEKDVLYVKGKFFTFTRKKFVQDMSGNLLYTVRNKFWTFFVRKALVYDKDGNQVAFMKNGRVVLVERLASLMDSARIVTATVTGQIDETNPLATLFKTLFSETISVERYGARYRILGRGLVDGYEERLRVVLKERLAETSIVRPTLEDIFVGYMTRKE